MFKNGVDVVPRVNLSILEVKKRVNDALKEYLERLYWKTNKSMRIEADGVKEWLSKAIAIENDEEDLKFYQNLMNEYDGFMKEIENNHIYSCEDPRENTIRKMLEIKNCVILGCDKNLGMSLFSLETMRVADENLMNQFGAKYVKGTEEDILKIVLDEIDSFEEGLSENQRDYINYAYKSRDIRKCEIVIPFLKSKHKVQKMSPQEIREKDVSNLKFRPIVDAKKWATRGYSGLIMGMLRKVNEELISRTGPVLKEIKVKNGWRFSRVMQDYSFEENYGAMVSADIGEAYTHITSRMINDSIEIVCRIIGYPNWKIEFIQKMVDLVLGNNYVLTSTGIYLFKKVLPMGYKLSGECLDIVALAGEISKMFNLGRPGVSNVGLPISEITEYPEELVKVDVETEVNMAKSIQDYKRYVDDTHGVLEAKEVEEILHGLLAIGYMFPRELTINLDLNIFRSEFLDVFCWRGLSSKVISTLMKRNYKVPFGHVKKESDHPSKYKLQSLLGEMLRNRRTASDPEIVEAIDNCIISDFKTIGYNRREIDVEYKKSQDKICSKYNTLFVKYEDEVRMSKHGYGGSIIYAGSYIYHEVLFDFISRCQSSSGGILDLRIVTVPGNKLKGIAYTKKRYLKRQQDDLAEKEKEAVKNSKM